MSTSLLYHAFNLKGVKYRSARYRGNRIILKVEMAESERKCRDCKSTNVIFKGVQTRFFHMPPLGRKRCALELVIHRICCKDCGSLYWPKLQFMDGKKRYTRSFALTVLDLLQFATIAAVADYLQVGWDLIKMIHKQKLQRIYRNPRLNDLVYLGIDEFSIRKGHSYMTIFVNLQTGQILHAVEGRTVENLTPFLQTLRRKAKKLKAVAMDMSTSYIKAVEEELSHVDIVFDRYHISALANKAIDDLRKLLQSEADEEGQKCLKGSRFLFLKNYPNLNNDNKVRLQNILDRNKPLFHMHYMKELLRLFWQFSNKERARQFLQLWCEFALESEIAPFERLGKTLEKYKEQILNYFTHRITNGVVEGINNKIKTLKRQAYGFRDMEYFKLRLLHLHRARYSFAG
jgi:transposase